MPITFAHMMLIAVVTLGIALAGRMNERAAHDRFSFDDAGAIESAAQ